jgi:hypothetical protein
MKVLREFIRDALHEARNNRTPAAPGGGIILHRVGGLSPVKQDNNRAPEKRGLWAFVWPYVEPYLLGSTNDRGVATADEREKENTRYGQMKREGLRKFVYRGPLYTRHMVPGSISTENGWTLVDADVYARWLSKYAAEVTAHQRGRNQDYRNTRFNVGDNPFRMYSKDEWEVFVPANKGKITSLKGER